MIAFTEMTIIQVKGRTVLKTTATIFFSSGLGFFAPLSVPSIGVNITASSKSTSDSVSGYGCVIPLLLFIDTVSQLSMWLSTKISTPISSSSSLVVEAEGLWYCRWDSLLLVGKPSSTTAEFAPKFTSRLLLTYVVWPADVSWSLNILSASVLELLPRDVFSSTSLVFSSLEYL